MRRIIQSFFIFLLIAFIGACSSDKVNRKKDEGRIIYEIEIIGDNIDPFMQSMMPNQAEYYFKKEKTTLSLSSRGNLVRFAAYSNGIDKEITQEIKLMNKKIKSNFDARQIFFYMDHPSFTLIETDFLDSLEGVVANHDIIIYDEIESKEAPLIYSKDINIINPNWYNIYNDIPYVLLQYEYNQFGMKLRLKVKSIEFMKIDDDIFESSDEYRVVTPEEFIDELKIIAESL